MKRPDRKALADPESVIRKRRRKLKEREDLKTLLFKILVLAAALAVMFGVVFGITPMKGGDMEPKISAGDLLLYYRLEKDFARNDVVLMERDGDQYAGRIIAMPGEVIEITPTGTMSIDGNQIVETDIFYETKPIEGISRYPLTLGEDEYFILADKRDTAKDSRYFGPVKGKEIKGKVITSVHRTGL